MAGKGTKRLTALEIGRLCKPGNYADGDQLYLRLRPDGSKQWSFRYKRGGEAHWMSLGPYQDVKLPEAREAARSLRNDLREGIDPLKERRKRQAGSPDAGHSFDAVAAMYIEAHKAGWKNEKHGAQWASTLAKYATPFIGGKRVGEIELDDILLILKPIWETKPETASRLRGRIESVLDFAAVHKWRLGDNCARWDGYLAEILPSRAKLASIEHHAALPWQDMPSFMSALRTKSAVSAHCLEFAVLTAARSGEARGTRWKEIDMQAAVWSIPGERMKSGKPHKVPLSPCAMEILVEVDALPHNPDSLTFPGGKVGSPLSDVALSKMLTSIRTGVTVHGFRSTFRDWCAEATDTPREIAEAALAHVNKNKVEAAYLRGNTIEKRRKLMEAWAAHCRAR